MRTKIDTAFYNWGAFVIRFRIPVLILILLATVFFGRQLPNLRFDMSNESFFKKDSPILLNYNAFRDQFGRDERIVVMVESDNLFTEKNLQKLKDLHADIEDNVPSVNKVSSLATARVTTGVEGALIVEDLLEEIPTSEEALLQLKNYVLAHPIYKNLLISEDGKLTVLSVETDAFSAFDENGVPLQSDANAFAEDNFDVETNANAAPQQQLPITDKENTLIVNKIQELIQKYNAPDFQIHYTGSPVVTSVLKGNMQKDMRKFTLLSILTIGIFLFVMFRRFSGVFLPLITVILSLIFTLGMMSLTGTAITIVIQILPSFLLAVGVGSTVHLMSMFYMDFQKDKENKEQAIKDALQHSGLPIMMTNLTTSAGLLSFSAAEIRPIGDLGAFAAFGVLICLFLTLTFIPAALSVLRNRSLKFHDKPDKRSTLDNILLAFGHLGSEKPKSVLVAFAVVMLIAFVGVPQLKLSHNVLNWFPAGHPVKIDTAKLDEQLKGSVSIELLVDSKRTKGSYNPEVLRGLSELETYVQDELKLKGEAFIGKASSFAGMVKEINQALNENNPEHYSIPDDRDLIAQEILLFENSGSDDLEDITDSLFQVTRFTAKAPWVDATTYGDLLGQIQEKADQIFKDTASVSITGMMVLFSQTINIMMKSMIQSYAIAGVVITFMMILLIGDVKTGLVSMIPNFSPIIFTLGFMGWMNIPLDMFTLLIGSIAIGLAVDDTIHFFHNFKKYFDRSHDARKSVDLTLLSTGRAMLVTSLVLVTGFMIFTLASMYNLVLFGLLTSMTMFLAFLADVLIAPALLTLLNKDKEILGR